jgi:hypothetical protein
MTTLATSPVDEPDLLALIADTDTPLRKPFADRFRDACWVDALAHDGWVNPSRVRALLLAEGPIDNPRQLSALWSKSCGRDGFMVKTDALVPIEGAGSRGNTNKSVPLRRWLGGDAA